MARSSAKANIRAVLGPTNTGKTHLAIERMCAHSSGAMGFPLRLLAREVYDRVRAIKGDKQVALITGEERIEPPQARYYLCTAEAMPRTHGGPNGDWAFVALDEAQLGADRDRGHIFTDRLLHARGREETMILGAATLEPLVRALIPEARIEERPRFSTLRHAGPVKLSRLPKRSAVVAFSIEQVYQTAELLRRFRGGAAVVMGALSPQTRNRQVELFQSGEVDYIVATDAIGMGLNLDVQHVAFAGLEKFDGVRQRRLTPAEMAQIAGRAGRHQTDGTFGTLAGNRGHRPLELNDDEVYAIEQHRFAPLTRLYWRNPAPRFDTVDRLIADLEMAPRHPAMARAPEAIDLAVLRRLADDADILAGARNAARVKRLWEACQLPDFRQQGSEGHARFVARLWRDLREGHIGGDFVAARIGELDRPDGDIDTLQGRLSAIRSWTYICQRPDWVLIREEMAARARAVEARLSDALHQRLTERFVNRRTSILMRGMGKDAGLLRVRLEDDGQVMVEDHAIGRLEGFRFVVDQTAGQEDRKLMLAAAEKHMPALLAQKAQKLVGEELGTLVLRDNALWRDDQQVAALERGKSASRPRLIIAKELGNLEPAHRARLEEALEHWLEGALAPLAPLRAIEDATSDPEAGSEVRALLLSLSERGGSVPREEAGLAQLPKERRPLLRKLGISIGALDVFVPALLRPAARRLLHELGIDRRPFNETMAPVIEGGKRLPAGYRHAGPQAVRLDMAEKLFRAAHEQRLKIAEVKDTRGFTVDTALATSMGLTPESFLAIMKDAGFRQGEPVAMAEGAYGPPRPLPWTWRPPRKDFRSKQGNQRTGQRGGNQRGKSRGAKGRTGHTDDRPSSGNAFAGLADLLG